MATYQEVSGNIDVSVFVTSPFDTKRLEVERIKLDVDTSNDAAIVDLPTIKSLNGFLNVFVYVNDRYGNAATNNITIRTNGGNVINGYGTQVVINRNNGGGFFSITGVNAWSFSGGIGSAAVFELWARGLGDFSLYHVNDDFPNQAADNYGLAMGASAFNPADRYASRSLTSGLINSRLNSAQYNEMLFRGITTDDSADQPLYADWDNGNSISQVLKHIDADVAYVLLQAWGYIIGKHRFGNGYVVATFNTQLYADINSTGTYTAVSSTVTIIDEDVIGALVPDITPSATAIGGPGGSVEISVAPVVESTYDNITVDWMCYMQFNEMEQIGPPEPTGTGELIPD